MMKLAEELNDPALLNRSLNSVAIVLVDAGGVTAYLALVERCVVLAREHHLLPELGRSLSNLCAELYPSDLLRAAELAEDGVTTSKRVGDAYRIEIVMANACFTWWLNGDWDRVAAELGPWFTDHEPTGSTGFMWLSLALVELARGESVTSVDVLDPEDPGERNSTILTRSLIQAASGDVAAAAAAAAEVALAAYSGDMLEDIEVHLAPAVELQLRAGDLDMAERLLALMDPLLGGRSRGITRGEHPRLRGMITAARGGDPEADFRAAEQAHAAYGAVFLLARTRLELGRWLTTRGRAEEARPVLAEARAAFERLGAAPSIADLDTIAGVPSMAGSQADQ